MGNREFGIWSLEFRLADDRSAAEAAALVESWGYRSIWIPGRDRQPGLFERVELLLSQTSSTTIGIGIANIWFHSPDSLATHIQRLEVSFPGRFLLGLGIGHRTRVEEAGLGTYDRPLARMATFLDAIQAATSRETLANRVVLAALGPRMIGLANDRCRGVHNYFAPPRHTRVARDLLGRDRLLITEQAVYTSARTSSVPEPVRAHMERYLGLENYRNHLRRLGHEIGDDGSHADDLIDELVSIGTANRHVTYLSGQLDAGADMACAHVLSGDERRLPLKEWETLADALGASGHSVG